MTRDLDEKGRDTMTVTDTETEATEASPPSLYKAVAAAAHRLQRDLLGQDAQRSARVRGVLSRLRRAAAQQPGEDPRAWWEVSEEVLGELPEGDLGRGDTPSHSEWAAFVAVTLFSNHQQSHAQPMHVAGVSLGEAVGTLRRRTESGSIKPRLDALMLATTEAGIRYHLRSLIGLLNAHSIPLDYGRLAEDLRRLRTPARRRDVVIRWGRGYAASLHPRPAATTSTE